MVTAPGRRGGASCGHSPREERGLSWRKGRRCIVYLTWIYHLCAVEAMAMDAGYQVRDCCRRRVRERWHGPI